MGGCQRCDTSGPPHFTDYRPFDLRAQYRVFNAAVNGDMGWFTPIQIALGRAGAAEHGVEHQPVSPAQ